MRAYKYIRKEVTDTALDGIAAAEEIPAFSSESKAAYEWNNALRIAAAKMWGDDPDLHGRLS